MVLRVDFEPHNFSAAGVVAEADSGGDGVNQQYASSANCVLVSRTFRAEHLPEGVSGGVAVVHLDSHW